MDSPANVAPAALNTSGRRNVANPRLSQIETQWSVVLQAHGDKSDETNAARAQIIEHYGDAIQRYLMACLRDPDAKDEVFQEFSLRFVRGDFKNVSADKGRFRSYIKTVICHLVADFGRRRKKYAVTAIEHESLLAGDEEFPHLDEQFQKSWRDSILAAAWEQLRIEDGESGKGWYTVLKTRSENPELRSAALAERVSTKLGRDVSAGNVRVLVHRARERFAEILVAAVRESLQSTDQEALEHELIDLNLWQYCKSLLRPVSDE